MSAAETGQAMKYFSTNEVCGILGISQVTMYKHIRRKTFEPPAVRKICGIKVRPWTEQDVERARAVFNKGKKPQGFEK